MKTNSNRNCAWPAVAAMALAPFPAYASCSVPNTLTNGQVADASQVMDNFNTIAGCVNTAASSAAPAGPVNSVQINADGTHLGAIGPLTNGQIVIGSTGSSPQAATLTAGAGIVVTNSAGAVTITATGTGFTYPTIRGSGMQASSASSYSVSWPTGTVAGDLAIIFIGGGWAIASVPTGWALVDQKTAAYWNGSVIAKILTSGDISSGSVTVNMQGTYDSALSIVTFQGGTTGISGLVSLQDVSGAATRTLTAPSAATGSLYLYFGSGRTSAAVSVSVGSALQAQSDGSAASGALYALSGPPFFGSASFNYADLPDGDYQAIIAVTGP